MQTLSENFKALVTEALNSIDERSFDETTNEILQKKFGEINTEKINLLKSQIENEIQGFGPIKSLLDDPKITEICINGYNEIFIEVSGKLTQTESSFVSTLTYDRFVKHILLLIEKTADTRHPTADGYLSDGSRIHICLPPLTTQPVVTIRKHNHSDWTLTDLVKSGMLDEELREKVREWVKGKKNLLVCGATGSGKTTFLRACLKEIDQHERVLTLEDTSEIGRLNSQHVNLITRIDPENLVPSIDLSLLVKNSLRMRPDRLVVGEVRGEEALYLLDALSTGHRGSMCTLHAHTAQHALKRLESLISRAAPRWDIMAIRQMIFDSINVVIICQNKNGLRKISQTALVSGIENFGYLLDSQEYE